MSCLRVCVLKSHPSLTRPPSGLNEKIFVKYLGQCLVPSKLLINGSSIIISTGQKVFMKEAVHV